MALDEASTAHNKADERGHQHVVAPLLRVAAGYRRGRSAALFTLSLVASIFLSSGAMAICSSEELAEEVVVLSNVSLSSALEESLSRLEESEHDGYFWSRARGRAEGAILIEVERSNGRKLKVVVEEPERPSTRFSAGSLVLVRAERVCCDVLPHEDPACYVGAPYRVPPKRLGRAAERSGPFDPLRSRLSL